MSIVYAKTGHLVTITLNRPDRLNAIDEPMQADLADAWLRYERDDDAWLAILSASGRAFCAGADKQWFERLQRGEDSMGLFLDGIRRDPFWSGSIEKPTIAAVNGPVVGAGFDLMLRADLRVAAEDAIFSMPEVDLGALMVVWENLPYAIAAEIVTGARLTARRAFELGLVNRLAPPGGALDVAQTWAAELLAKPPLALQQGLKLIREIRNRNQAPSTSDLREQATELSRRLAQTEDTREAVAALLQRRQPQYRRR